MSTRRLPAQLRWPVTRADLLGTLGPVVDQVSISWTVWDRQGTRYPVVAEWVPLDRDFPPGGVSVWIRPVRRDLYDEVSAAVRREVLPDLAAWTITAGQVNVQDADGMHVLDRERNGRRSHD